MESELSQNQLIIVAPIEVQQKLHRRLDSSGFNLHWCDNVYKATAVVFGLVKNKAHDQRPLTVFAWIDNLSYSQLRFFSVLASNGGIVPIAFSDLGQEKLQKAVELGALRGVLTDELPALLMRNKRENADIMFARAENRLKQEMAQPVGVCDIATETDLGQENPKPNWFDVDISLTSEELDSLLLDEQGEVG